jgi:F0F1-type ATP synthase alpha subunit
MQIKPDEITSILKSRIEGLDTSSADLAEVGTVLSVADGIARVHGLENCMSFEMLELPHGVTGLALNLESDNVGAVLFGNWEKIVEGDTVRRTGRLLEIPVGSSTRSATRSTARVRSTRRRRGRSSTRPPASSSASRSRSRCRRASRRSTR